MKNRILSAFIAVALALTFIPAFTFSVTAAETVTIDGINYSIENGKATVSGHTGGGGSIVIPATITSDAYPVTAIGEYAFYGSGITRIEIPASVKNIGTQAFFNCVSLSTVTFEEDSVLESIGTSAFGGSGITSIAIPASVKSIGIRAFLNCVSLTAVTFEEGNVLESIGDRAFEFSGITSIEIPASVKSIGEDAFFHCTSLTTVTFADGSILESIGESAFELSGITSIAIPASVKSIGDSAFSGCSSLTEIYCVSGSVGETYAANNYSSITRTLFIFDDSADYDIPSGVGGTTYTSTTELATTEKSTSTITYTIEPQIDGLSIVDNKLVYTRPATAQAATTATVKASDGIFSKTIEVNIGEVTPQPPTITTDSLSGGTVGTAYSQALQATGSTPIAWSLADGSVLPAGFTLDANTGVISGTPTAAGTYDITVKAENTGGEDTKQLSIEIVDAPVTPPTGGTTTTSKPSNPNSTTNKAAEAARAKDGDTVKLDLSGKSDKTIDKEILNNIKGKDVELKITVGDGVEWVINGNDIPSDLDAKDIDLSVKTGSDSNITKIPVTIVDELGNEKLVYAELGYDGDFGFKMTLKMNVGKDYAGKYANLYYYNKDGKLELLRSVKVEDDGTVKIPFDHASSYVISLTAEPKKTDDMSELAAGEGIEFTEIPVAVQNGIPFMIISILLTAGMVIYKRKRV